MPRCPGRELASPGLDVGEAAAGSVDEDPGELVGLGRGRAAVESSGLGGEVGQGGIGLGGLAEQHRDALAAGRLGPESEQRLQGSLRGRPGPGRVPLGRQ